MYISDVPGRIRIGFDNHVFADQMAEKIKEIAGVLEVSAGKRTGSLLIRFEESKFDRSALKVLMEKHLPQSGKVAGKSRKKITTMSIIKKGMLSSLGLSLVSAILDEEGPHIAMGTVFLGLLGYHLYIYRKRLLT